MNFIFVFFVCILANISGLEAKTSCPDCYLKGKISSTDKRYVTFFRALDLITERGAKVLVETGTARNGSRNCAGDGCSTVIFANWAKANNAILYSVDIDKNALKNASGALQRKQKPFVCFVQSDSVTFLENFGTPIDFLYLDSYDFEIENPAPSQQHHLREIQAAYPYLHDKTLVMIDDCDLPYGGKGPLVVEYLLERDWVILEKGYQILMGKM